jgi:hypothetical protein
MTIDSISTTIETTVIEIEATHFEDLISAINHTVSKIPDKLHCIHQSKTKPELFFLIFIKIKVNK